MPVIVQVRPALLRHVFPADQNPNVPHEISPPVAADREAAPPVRWGLSRSRVSPARFFFRSALATHSPSFSTASSSHTNGQTRSFLPITASRAANVGSLNVPL